MTFGDRPYESAIMLPKSLNYPESAYEALVTSFELASAYFAGQHDATLIGEQEWPIDFKNPSSFFVQLSGRTTFITETTLTDLCFWHWDLPDFWDTVILHLLYIIAFDTILVNASLTLDDGVNPVDTQTRSASAGNIVSPSVVAQGLNTLFNFDTRIIEIEVPIVNIDNANNPIRVTPAMHAVYLQNTLVAAPVRPMFARVFARKDY